MRRATGLTASGCSDGGWAAARPHRNCSCPAHVWCSMPPRWGVLIRNVTVLKPVAEAHEADGQAPNVAAAIQVPDAGGEDKAADPRARCGRACRQCLPTLEWQDCQAQQSKARGGEHQPRPSPPDDWPLVLFVHLDTPFTLDSASEPGQRGGGERHDLGGAVRLVRASEGRVMVNPRLPFCTNRFPATVQKATSPSPVTVLAAGFVRFWPPPAFRRWHRPGGRRRGWGRRSRRRCRSRRHRCPPPLACLWPS